MKGNNKSKNQNNRYFRNQIRKYYYANKRCFYWRENQLNPFQVLVTELFLKKTKAETVDRYGWLIIKKYSSSKKILNASDEDIFKNISLLGLGNQRTRALKIISSYVESNFDGKVPGEPQALINIPHVGSYIANATACFAFNKRVPVIDVNSSRIISRYFSLSNDKDVRNNIPLHVKAKELLPRGNYKEYNWGLLDLGAMVCKTGPLCSQCLLRKRCYYAIESKRTN